MVDTDGGVRHCAGDQLEFCLPGAQCREINTDTALGLCWTVREGEQHVCTLVYLCARACPRMRLCVSVCAHANAGVSTLTLAPDSRDKYPGTRHPRDGRQGHQASVGDPAVGGVLWGCSKRRKERNGAQEWSIPCATC